MCLLSGVVEQFCSCTSLVYKFIPNVVVVGLTAELHQQVVGVLFSLCIFQTHTILVDNTAISSGQLNFA